MARPGILIVEDDPDIAELILFHVLREGYTGRTVGSGRLALEEIRKQPPTLVVLDLMLPDLDGLEVCRQLKWKPETRSIPILIVSAKGEETDIVTGLEMGAEDYITKPFSPKVLVARMKNILRRLDSDDTNVGNRHVLAGGDLVIDIDRHHILIKGDVIDFTPTEFGILKCLASRPGFVRTRDQLISSVHGQHTVLCSRTIDVHVTTIRRKLGDMEAMIQTVRGVGYRLGEMPTKAATT